MGRHLHLFETISEFENVYNGEGYEEPWVSYVEEVSGVQYNKGTSPVPPGPSTDTPLTFEIISGGNIYWTCTNKTGCARTIEYRKKSGEGGEWGEWTSITSTSAGTAIPVVAGDILEFRGDNENYYISGSTKGGSKFDPTTGTSQQAAAAIFNVYGNIMSLISKTGYAEMVTLPGECTFKDLFIRSKIYDASELLLPATALTYACYNCTFKDCTLLESAPALPATVLADSCYYGMFNNCPSLTTAPILPAKTLVTNCYGNMFLACANLNRIECMATNISASNCTSRWVEGVSATGTFVKASGMSGWGIGTSGIPTNWVVMDEDAGEGPDYTLHESTNLVHSEILRIPDSLGIRQFNENGGGRYSDWTYTDGIFLKGVIDTYIEYNSDSYDLSSLLEYVGHYYGTKINSSGAIDSNYDNTQLDDKEPAMALFKLYDLTGLEKYKLCLDMLYDNDFSTINKNIDGVFYHKVTNYPRQGWLDGLYMGEPFRAEYAKRFLTGSAQAAVYDDVVYQITKLTEKTYDSATGLYRHAYDSSAREGQSPASWVDPNSVSGEQAYYAWSRALGWALMAIVDVLEILPDSHTGRTSLTNLLSGMCQGILTYRDSSTGVWRNVLTEPATAGTVNQNGFESSSSAMFAYAWLKGVRLGYLPISERSNAISIYQSIKSNFFGTETYHGETTLTYSSVCSTGNPGKDCNTKAKVYANYCNKEFFDNNTHGFAPAIYAALEYERLTNS